MYKFNQVKIRELKNAKCYIKNIFFYYTYPSYFDGQAKLKISFLNQTCPVSLIEYPSKNALEKSKQDLLSCLLSNAQKKSYQDLILLDFIIGNFHGLYANIVPKGIECIRD